jgi:hypothetical protein
MRVLVCGSRHFNDKELFDSVMEEFKDKGVTIIQGNARGADTLAYYWALQYAAHEEHYQADWKKYGKAAGYIRNKQMLDDGEPDLVIAFWDGESPGTAMMISLAEKAGVPVKVIHVDP